MHFLPLNLHYWNFSGWGFTENATTYSQPHTSVFFPVWLIANLLEAKRNCELYKVAAEEQGLSKPGKKAPKKLNASLRQETGENVQEEYGRTGGQRGGQLEEGRGRGREAWTRSWGKLRDKLGESPSLV